MAKLVTSRGGVAVYVTSHGFGHLNRTVAVLNRLPKDVPVTIRCHRNLFQHWGERLMRPAEFGHYVSDVGALNPPGDSAATDGPGTLVAAEQIFRESFDRLDEEVAVLKKLGARCVFADAPPIPLLAAKRAGLPGFLLGNFTWAEIYEPHARKVGPEAVRFVNEFKQVYRQATLVFRSEPALTMRSVSPAPIENVGMVVTPGKDRQAELKQFLGLSKSARIVYFYVGRYGQENLDWGRLANLEKLGIHFVGFHPAPTGPLPNLHVVPAEHWTGADLAASADAIVAKAGYGAVCEAMVARTPMIYPPRVGFSEHRALSRAMNSWGGGICVPARDFGSFRIERALDRALALRPGPPPFPANGAQIIADRIRETVLAGS